MKAKFHSPFGLDDTTGGSIFNKALLEWLKARGFEIDYVQSPTPEPIKWAVSITHFLDGPFCRYPIKPKGKTIALMHLPAFADPSASHQDSANERDVLHDVSLIVVTHDRMKGEMEDRYALPADKIITIQPGLAKSEHKNQYSPIPSKLVYVANFNPIKNHEGLMHLLTNISDLNWSIDCYGAGELKPYIAALCTSLGLEQKVNLLPPVPHNELLTLLPTYDLALNFSLSETYGMYIQECIGARLPLLTTKVGWIQDLNYTGAIDLSSYQDQLVDTLTQTYKYQSLIRDTQTLSKMVNTWNFSPLKPWL